MNDLTVFNFEAQPIRTYTDENGDTWFCFCDIAKVLEISNLSYLKKRLNEKGCRLTSTLTKGGMQNLIFVNEGNLYRMTCRSDKPKAKKFENWVYDEVLPSIRKTGAYVSGQGNKPVMTIEDIKKAFSAAKGEIVAKSIRKEIAAAVREAVKEEISRLFAAEGGTGDDKTGYGMNEFNFGQWRLNAVMALDAMNALYEGMKNRQADVVKMLNAG